MSKTSDEGGQKGHRKNMAWAYDELKRLAQKRMRNERKNHTLQASALVGEIFLKIDKESGAPDMTREDLLIAGARVIQQILIDHARAKTAIKRGGGKVAAGSDALDRVADSTDRASISAVGEALDLLEKHNKQDADLVRLRFFGGLEMKEIADTLGISLRTAQSRWKSASDFLRKQLSDGEPKP